MTTPQQIDGDIIDPDQWTGRVHPSIIDPTMAERKRCLAWIDRFTDQIQDCAEEVRDNGKRQDLLDVLESFVADIRDFRTRIESGEQP